MALEQEVTIPLRLFMLKQTFLMTILSEHMSKNGFTSVLDLNPQQPV